MRALTILLSVVGLLGPTAAQDLGPVVAHAGAAVVHEAQLEPLLIQRYAMGPEGRELAKVLMSSKLITRVAEERGVRISNRELDRKFDEIDKEASGRGTEGGLLHELRVQGLSVKEFRSLLRIALLQEKMTREDKGISKLLPVTGPMQESWLAALFMENGVVWPTPPFADGLVGTTKTGVSVTLEEFADMLRLRLPRPDVEETVWHLVLLEGIESRLVDVSDETYIAAIDAEIERRRQQHAVAYPGITFEQRLGASGRTLESFSQEPSLRIGALARLWVDLKYGDTGLREAFEAERSYYEGRYGSAVQANLLFLVGSMHKNDLNPRTFAEAELQLTRLMERVGNTDDFRTIVLQNSEEPTTRTSGGDLGWVTRADPRVPANVRHLLYQFVDAGGEIPPQGIALGPHRLDTGAIVLWISAQRESPEWSVMSSHVHNVMRARFLDGIAKRTDVTLL